MTPYAALDAALGHVCCPVCGEPLRRGGASVGCPRGHGFDLGRGGYLNLRTGRSRRVDGDTAAMVAARETFLAAGHYDPLTARLAQVVGAALDGADRTAPLVLEIGAGTGHHLAGVVAASPGTVAVAADVSKYALRRAARAHPRIAAVAFDVATAWPVAPRCVAAVLDVFAPRNLPQMHRVLRPGGLLVVVTPGPGHLAELRGPLGLVGMDTDKSGRLDQRTAGLFEPAGAEEIIVPMALRPAEIVDLALMGPTGHHRTLDELRHRVNAAFPGGTDVTARFHLRRYRPVPDPGGQG